MRGGSSTVPCRSRAWSASHRTDLTRPARQCRRRRPSRWPLQVHPECPPHRWTRPRPRVRSVHGRPANGPRRGARTSPIARANGAGTSGCTAHLHGKPRDRCRQARPVCSTSGLPSKVARRGGTQRTARAAWLRQNRHKHCPLGIAEVGRVRQALVRVRGTGDGRPHWSSWRSVGESCNSHDAHRSTTIKLFDLS